MTRFLLATALVLITTTASAQLFFYSPQLGETMPATRTIRNEDGTVRTTATTWGGITVYRNGAGELTGSSKLTASGVITYYDPDGKITMTATSEGNVTTMRDAAGQITGTQTREGEEMIMRDAAGQVLGKTIPDK